MQEVSVKMKKKLQVFVSSTYLDLQSERQAAVQAILDAGHIPAGMELFRAGNESQLITIKKWIDNSDAYMLILGGRYGSVDDKTSKSYTQIEYEYAIEKGIPVFSVILSDSFLHIKAAKKIDVFEKDYINQYNEFKKLVMSKLIKHVEDEKDIKLAVHATLSDFLEEYNLMGWVRGSDILENSVLIRENADLIKENSELKLKLQEQMHNSNTTEKNVDEKIGYYKYSQLYQIFHDKTFGNKNALDLYKTLCEKYIGIVIDGYNPFYDLKVFQYFLTFDLIEITTNDFRSKGVFDDYPVRISENGRSFYRQILLHSTTA